MATSKKRHSIPGSERTPMPGARAVKAADPDERIQVTVAVRSRVSDAAAEAAMYKQARKLPRDRRYLTREELAENQGADPDDIAKVETFAQNHHLTVVEASPGKRAVKLAGRVADMNAAFGVSLKQFRSRAVSYRGRTGPVTVPAELAGVVIAVHGLDNRPAAKPRYRALGAKKSGKHPASGPPKKKKPGGVAPRNAPDGSFSVPEIAKLYGFPAGLDGTGQCIGLIELNSPADPRFPTQNVGAGYTTSDLNKFFSKLGLATPTVIAVGIDGGGNIPTVNPDADGEVTLDVEVAGAIAPGATIVVYFAPNTDKGFIDALGAAVHDTVHKPSVISISWGGPEDFSKKTFLDGISRALLDASQVGVTVCVAAGDSGSSDLDPQDADGQPHADFPASSPFALACGGTKMHGSGTTITSESVWNEGRDGGSTGGGVSNKFAIPAYQKGAKVPKSPSGKSGRGVPDVSGVADPLTGYQVVIAGKSKPPIGGTSAVAPLWAGLVARINQKLAAAKKPTVGFVNTLLYGGPLAGALRDIVKGDNDIDGNLNKYAAKAGWDPCTGLGSPNGAKLLNALT
jgi:kumamolisin